MADSYATTEPLTTTPVTTHGICGETIEVSAYANTIMLDVFEGPVQIDVHLSLAAAEGFVQDLRAAIMAARLIGRVES